MKRIIIIILILSFAFVAFAKIAIDLKLGVENYRSLPPSPVSGDIVWWDASEDQVLWDASGDVILWD